MGLCINSFSKCYFGYESIISIYKSLKTSWNIASNYVLAVQFWLILIRSQGPQFWNESLNVSRSPGPKVSRSKHLKVSGSPGLKILRYLDLKVSRSQCSKGSGSQSLRVSRYQGLKVPKSLGLNSGSHGLRVSRY